MSQLYFFSSEVHFPKCTRLKHVSFASLSKYQTWIISNKDFFVIEIISKFLVFFSALLPPCPPISDPPPWGWPEDLFMTSFMRPVIVARNWRDTIDLSLTKAEQYIQNDIFLKTAISFHTEIVPFWWTILQCNDNLLSALTMTPHLFYLLDQLPLLQYLPTNSCWWHLWPPLSDPTLAGGGVFGGHN